MRFFASLFSLISCVILISHVVRCETCQRCTSPEECNAPPPNPCPYGEYRNMCSRRACLKGPGEKCGGPLLNSFGICTRGLYCHKEGRCYGCFLANLECYPKEGLQ